MCRKPSAFATCSIFEPGSVIAIKWLPAFPAPTAFSISAKKYCLRMFGSRVEPDLLATTASVFVRSTLSRVAFTCAGSVESTMCSTGYPLCGPKVTPRTSGQRLEPPMPRSNADWNPDDFTSAARDLKEAASFSWRSTMSIHPSHFSSPSLVHRLASLFQKRSTFLLSCQSAAAASTAPRRSRGNSNRKFISLLIVLQEAWFPEKISPNFGPTKCGLQCSNAEGAISNGAPMVQCQTLRNPLGVRVPPNKLENALKERRQQ